MKFSLCEIKYEIPGWSIAPARSEINEKKTKKSALIVPSFISSVLALGYK